MDVVLEVFDTFFFDRIYANVLPIHPSVSSFDPISTIAASFKGYGVNNSSTWGGARAGGEFARSGWEWKPASQYFSVRPSEYAWMSRWDRDDFYRQVTSLYFVTW